MLIQEQSGTAWAEMYKVFNMGHRFELYVPGQISKAIIQIAESFELEAKIVGYCEGADKKGLTIQSENGEFSY